HLLAVLDRLERRSQGDLRLAVADVAAYLTVHRPAPKHVGLDLLDGPRLVRRLCVGERLLQLPLPGGVRGEAEPGRRLAGGVDLEQLAGQVVHGPRHPPLGALPLSATELTECGCRAARIAGDAADLV